MSFDPNAAAGPETGPFGLSSTTVDAKVVLLPVRWDATTSYRAGTAKGPDAILAASRQVDLYDVETGRPYLAGIAFATELDALSALNDTARAEAEKVIAVGGAVEGDPALEAALASVNESSRAVDAQVYGEARRWLAEDKIVAVVGGDHSTPLGSIHAHAERWPGLGILHVDAHADLRRAYEGFERSHASIMQNVLAQVPVGRIVQVGIRDLCDEELEAIARSEGRVSTHFDVSLAKARLEGRLLERFARIADELPSEVYVSFDVDGLDPALCPHTGTPVPGGLSFHEASALLGAVVASGRRIVGFDLNEVAPNGADTDDEWDANVGARLLYKLIGWTLLSQGIGERPRLD